MIYGKPNFKHIFNKKKTKSVTSRGDSFICNENRTY